MGKQLSGKQQKRKRAREAAADAATAGEQQSEPQPEQQQQRKAQQQQPGQKHRRVEFVEGPPLQVTIKGSAPVVVPAKTIKHRPQPTVVEQWEVLEGGRSRLTFSTLVKVTTQPDGSLLITRSSGQ